MLCGSTNEKAGCFSGPKSPASTAGNSTPRSIKSIDFASSLIWGELKEEVLLLSATPWIYPLVTPEEIAKLSRSICLAHECFLGLGESGSTLAAWRLFQAADNTYQGYVTMRDLEQVVRGILPRLDPDLSGFSQRDSAVPLVFWDVIGWWRELDLTDREREVIEVSLIKRTVVPSDGLWTGVSIGSSVRVWKNVCRSAGHLFRFQAQSFLESTFRAIQAQGLTRFDLLKAEKEVLHYLISESMVRIYPKGVCLWEEFVKLDEKGEGYMGAEGARSILRKMKINNYDQMLSHILPITNRSESLDTSALLMVDSTKYSLLQLVEALSTKLDFSKNIKIFPGNQNPPKIGSLISSFFTFPVFLRPRTKPIIESSTNFAARHVKILVKQYLDLEQWRGQKSAELCSKSA